jgi:calcium permeable stress-gated cation channel
MLLLQIDTNLLNQSLAVYPRTYNPTFATGACILAIIFACTFSIIFPLIGPAVVVLLFLTLVGRYSSSDDTGASLTIYTTAHRYLVGYVYARTHSQTGGLLQIWLLRRFATLLAFQPILLGLIFLSRRLWILAGVLLGVAAGVVILVEIYCNWKTRLPGRRSLSAITQDSLRTFASTAHMSVGPADDDETNSFYNTSRQGRTRGSMASVLDMMSLTLAVEPSPSQQRGPVPLRTYLRHILLSETDSIFRNRHPG